MLAARTRRPPARPPQTEAEAEAKAADTRVKHLAKALTDSKRALANKEKEGSRMLRDLEAERSKVERARAALAAIQYDPAAAQSLEEQAARARSDLQRCRDRVDELGAQVAGATRAKGCACRAQRGHELGARPATFTGVDFQYRDPERNFDRSRVKGVVARLVRVADPAAATALEVAAGGKLYQVVVDSEQTAKALLANGQLRNRVTIIPLNKVSAREVAPSAAAAARGMVGDRAQPALELVGYDAELSAAMKYAFGSAFVCKVRAAPGSRALRRSASQLAGGLAGARPLLT